MKLWFDHKNPAPEGYLWSKTVLHARVFILTAYHDGNLEVIDIGDDELDPKSNNNHNSSRLLEWLEEEGLSKCKIHLHGSNEYNIKELRAIIKRNGWEEV